MVQKLGVFRVDRFTVLSTGYSTAILIFTERRASSDKPPSAPIPPTCFLKRWVTFLPVKNIVNLSTSNTLVTYEVQLS